MWGNHEGFFIHEITATTLEWVKKVLKTAQEEKVKTCRYKRNQKRSYTEGGRGRYGGI